MDGTAKNFSLIATAVALVAFANVVLKLRVTALSGGALGSWLSYMLSLALDPWVWMAVIAAVAGGVVYVTVLRQLELSVLEPLFALVFIIVPLAAVFVLGEHLPPLRIAGIVLIFVGVILVGRTA